MTQDNVKGWILAILTVILISSIGPISKCNAQSIDSVWVFQDSREFVDNYKTPLLVFFGIGTVAAQGYLHGAFYNREYADIHLAAEILGGFHYGTSYVAGLDPIQSLGVAMLGDVLFQGFINSSYGKPFFYDYNQEYKVAGKDFFLPRLHGSPVQIPIGILFITYPYIIKWVF